MGAACPVAAIAGFCTTITDLLPGRLEKFEVRMVRMTLDVDVREAPAAIDTVTTRGLGEMSRWAVPGTTYTVLPDFGTILVLVGAERTFKPWPPGSWEKDCCC